MGTDRIHALLVLTLVRSSTADPAVDAAVERFRDDLRGALGASAGAVTAYDVVVDANDRWTGGGIDHAAFETRDARDTGAAAVTRLRADLPPDPTVSLRAFAVENNLVRPSPVGGLHLFSSGGMAEGFDRPTWQARWRAHANLIDTTPAFSPYLTGYVQHHGVDAATAARLGLDDTHGIAHMTYRGAEEQALALALPEYLEVLRPDENEFVSRDRGMRVRVAVHQ